MDQVTSAIDLVSLDLKPRFTRILETCVPFVITYPANHGALDLTPFGISVAPRHRFTATRLDSRDAVDGLHHLDALTFGDQDMLMPRWVLFDCGEFPGLVFGFGRLARDLPDYVRQAYRVEDRDDAFVPLSMWVAIRNAEDRAWFGHNLSSANILLREADALPGLALLTKVLGVKATRCAKQYGATQWASASIGLHLQLGDMALLSAYTPAHTHPETLAYRIDVEDERLVAGLTRAGAPASPPATRVIDGTDGDAIRALHAELEAGARWTMVAAERRGAAHHRLHLRSG